MRRYTIKGRVVYDRKFHPFSSRDVERIGKSIGAQIFEITGSASSRIWESLFDALNLEGGSGEVIDESIIFGGGSFGGAGATREYVRKPSKRIVIIVER